MSTSSHHSESGRAGAAREIDPNDKDTSIMTKESARRRYQTNLTFGDPEKQHPGELFNDPLEGGGHKGATHKYGNDEMKPDTMNEDAKIHEPITSQRMWDNDKDVTFQDACRFEKQLSLNCHQDNKNNQNLCKEADNEVITCMRYYGKYFPSNNKNV
eukprot:403377452